MRIAVVASPILKTPPNKYGGIERITYWLGRRLAGMNGEHIVHLFGREGSYLDGAFVHTYNGWEDPGFASVVKEADDAWNFDVIHDCTHDKLLMQHFPHLASKTVNSLQGMAKRGPNTTCISQAQREALGYSEFVPVVYHGVPISEYPPLPHPTRDYFLYMGSINDYKGVDIAVDVCKKAGRKLLIAGVCWEPPYQEKLIDPFLDDNVRFVGEVGGYEKLQLIQNARALLHPVRWTEPGAIIISEALACGVPVIGSNNGVIPELINPAVGIIAEVQHFDSYQKMTGGAYNVDQWLAALDQVDSISRDDCHEYAAQRLNDYRMTDEYVECYKRVKQGETWG